VAIGLTALTLLAIRQDRRAAWYPGAVLVSSHANYKGLPFHYNWDEVYQTGDPFPAVYNWYSTGFDLGAEAEANGTCILLKGSTDRMVGARRMSVLICETPNGQMAFVNRATSFR